MEQFQEQGTQDVKQDPNAQAKHHKTNEFYNLASEAIGVPRESAKDIVNSILRNVIQRITPEEGLHLVSQLPWDLKQDCSTFASGPDKSIDAEKIKSDILNSSDMRDLDPEKVARDFWAFLTGWLNEYEDEKKGETFDVLNQLPKDIEKLFGRVVG